MSRECDGVPGGGYVTSYGPCIHNIIILLAMAAVLLWAVGPRFRGAGKNAKGAAARLQIDSNFSQALKRFRATVGRYPSTREGLRALALRFGEQSEPILRKIPRDPWGNEYQYARPGPHNVKSYDLWSFGPDRQPGGGDDITNWKGNP